MEPPNAELMRISGVTHQATFYHGTTASAVGDLPAEVGRKPNLTSCANPKPSYENRTSSGSITEPGRGAETTPSGRQTLPRKPYRWRNPTKGGEIQTRTVGKPNQTTIESAIALADEMEADGDERDTHSPFQVRRKRQIELIQQAWQSTL